MQLKKLQSEIQKNADPIRAKNLRWFFKTGKGEYGEGDVFIGLTVPLSRKIAQQFKYLNLKEISQLLKSKIHEERLIALLILIYNFENTPLTNQEKIFKFYLRSTRYINNWDLVDLSAHKILGVYLRGQSKQKTRVLLTRLAHSKNIWERRIAVLTTFNFIKYNRFNESLLLAKFLLNDQHDLIHKAVGWMLREVGKRNSQVEMQFLKKYYQKMPRTMLRYAIEKFNEKERQKYLKNLI